MAMKTVKVISLVIFILALPLMLFTASVSMAANNPWLYRYGFERYDISRVTGIPEAELDKVAHGLIDYWNSGEDIFNITVIKDGHPFTLFNEKEVSHLIDVKAIFRLIYKLLFGSFIYALAFLLLALFLWKDRKLLGLGLIWGSALGIALMVLLGILAITDFNWLFWQFHLVSFTNDLWLLNPDTDYLIMLFPEGFWFDAAIFCTAFKIVLAIITGFIGWRLLKTGTV